jgi:hypothetical protein
MIFFLARKPPQWVRASTFTRFLNHTQWRNTVGRTPLDEWSARRRDFCLTTHNTHNRHTCRRWDSNPQSEQASGRRTTSQTARPPAPAMSGLVGYNSVWDIAVLPGFEPVVFIMRIRCDTAKPNFTVVPPHCTCSCTRAIQVKSVHDYSKYGRSHVVTWLCSCPFAVPASTPIAAAFKGLYSCAKKNPWAGLICTTLTFLHLVREWVFTLNLQIFTFSCLYIPRFMWVGTHWSWRNNWARST